jgi:HlyD family secretion protein
MTADVDIVTAGAEDVLLVPNQAIEADRAAGRYYVRIPAAPGQETASPEEATERVEVRIGLRDESQTQVVEGLAEGDLVVLPRVPEQGEPDNRFGPPQNGGRGPFGEG